MTHTLISLLSICIGIIASNLFALFSKKNALGFTTNTIVGVFGSIFVIKSFGRLGFSPTHIITANQVNLFLLLLNFLLSSTGAIVALILAKSLKNKTGYF